MNEVRTRRRLERQLTQLGAPGWQLSDQAAALLLARGRARRLVDWPCTAVLVGAAGYLWWLGTFGPFQNHTSNVDGPGPEVVHYTPAHQLVTSAAVGLLLLMFLLGRYLAWRADLRVARGLRCRVSSGRRESVRTVLGPWGLVMLGAQLGLQVTLISWAALSRPAVLALLLAATSVAALGVSAVGLVRETTRPALAVDATSLFLDQRLRTSDALVSCAAPTTCLGFLVSGDNGGGWVALMAIPIGFGSACMIGLMNLGAPRNRWRSRARDVYPPTLPAYGEQ